MDLSDLSYDTSVVSGLQTGLFTMLYPAGDNATLYVTCVPFGINGECQPGMVFVSASGTSKNVFGEDAISAKVLVLP